MCTRRYSLRRLSWPRVGFVLLLLICILIYCEFLVYYLVLNNCHYAELPEDEPVEPGSPPLRVMFVTDTHLLGSRMGHWFDKLRREWQMHRAFQTAMFYFHPDLVFFLGDLFDEGKWSSNKEFMATQLRFQELFRVPSSTKVFVVAGNHDIGFHYAITPHLHQRFVDAFQVPKAGVHHLVVRDTHFVLVNSMAMHGDNCSLCSSASGRLDVISEELTCLQPDQSCDRPLRGRYSRPVLLQHFPLYRQSDSLCNEPDDAGSEKEEAFRPLWDCLSKSSSDFLLNKLAPRLIVSGHTHHGCRLTHRFGPQGQLEAPEWSVASFSWRYKNNPSFVLARFTPNQFALSKCYLPEESSVIDVYKFGLAIVVAYCLIYRKQFYAQRP